MTGPADPYREWDAAYLLGALSPAERREYEAHLATCPQCSAEVAGLAGLPGVMSLVPAEKAFELVDPGRQAEPPDLLPKLAAATDRVRRRARRRTVALVAAAAAVAAALVWVIPGVGSGDEEPPVAGRTVSMSRVGPARPLHASARLISEKWGTRIEAECGYDRVQPTPGGQAQRSIEYALFVTDRTGKAWRVATWLAQPGTTATPYATVTMAVDQIAKIDIRSMRTGNVLLQATL